MPAPGEQSLVREAMRDSPARQGVGGAAWPLLHGETVCPCPARTLVRAITRDSPAPHLPAACVCCMRGQVSLARET